MPGIVRDYLKEQFRIRYTYNVDEDGFRVTLPKVVSDHKILLVGDSVGFGIGVNDDRTITSFLQKKLGNRYQVINAAVGGYGGIQAYTMAMELAGERTYDALIYIAYQNDFTKGQEEEVLKKFHTLGEPYSNNIIVALQTSMQYTLDDILIRGPKSKIEHTDRLRERVAKLSEGLGFGYIDWSAIVRDHMIQSGSIMSRFGLYVDHVHLSPLGNSLLADKLYEQLEVRGLVLITPITQKGGSPDL